MVEWSASCVEEVDASVRSSRVTQHAVVLSNGAAVVPPSRWRTSDMSPCRDAVSRDVNTRTHWLSDRRGQPTYGVRLSLMNWRRGSQNTSRWLIRSATARAT